MTMSGSNGTSRNEAKYSIMLHVNRLMQETFDVIYTNGETRLLVFWSCLVRMLRSKKYFASH